MFNLYFKIAIRYLQKNKLYSFINIIGLAIGVASFILIMLYVNYERSYDKFEGSENVFRVFIDAKVGDTFEPDSKFSSNKGSHGEPCKKFTNRITPNELKQQRK